MESKKKYGGVFWLIEKEILAIPFYEGANIGLAKSGKNYNHKLLWDHVKPKGCNKEFDYYPRGRIEIDKRNRVVIFMSPCIEQSYVPQIMDAFAIKEFYKVHYDGSQHYRCHFDNDMY